MRLYGQVFQSAIGKTLQVSVINRWQGTAISPCDISSGTGEISIRIVYAPYVCQKILRNETWCWWTIRSPKGKCITGWVPVLFPHSLKEHGKVNAIPFCIKSDAVRIARKRITYNPLVLNIISTDSLFDLIIAIKIEIFHVYPERYFERIHGA